MSRTFDLVTEPFDKGQKIFKKKSVIVEPGVTVLVGCNGSGKTTMLRQIKDKLDRAGDKYLIFDNHVDGDRIAMDMFMWNNKIDQFATMACSSEGERIMVVLGDQAGKIGRLSRSSGSSDIYILMDAVDSGFSIDNIIELKTLLFDTVIEDHTSRGGQVYIICTANSYEMAREEDCIDAAMCSHIRFSDYEEYRKFILQSKKKKEKRDSRGG